MIKRVLTAVLLVVCLFLLCSCAKANDYGLKFASDGSDKLQYIHVFGEEQIVYTVGGVVTVEINGEPKLLDLALNDGDLAMTDVLDSVAEDAADGDVEFEEYPDGSVEYRYDTFTLVRLNLHTGVRDVYFVPNGMGYYDVIH